MFTKIMVLMVFYVVSVPAHGPPRDRDNEDIAMGRKMGAKWCSMAKVCNHDRVPICGVSHAGDVMGFRDLCDMFDYNCIRRRTINVGSGYSSKLFTQTLIGRMSAKSPEHFKVLLKLPNKFLYRGSKVQNICATDIKGTCILKRRGRYCCRYWKMRIQHGDYKQTGCPQDKSLLTASRRPTNSYYDD